jgi:glutamate synthase (NADPH/NADH) small chain
MANESASSRRAEDGGVLYSSDPRNIGWVRENIPCQTACPAGTNIPAYIQAIIEGKYGSSYEINREANVLPGVLGRICSRPCEDVCRHGQPGNVFSGTEPSPVG